jgi:hypothetical protein
MSRLADTTAYQAERLLHVLVLVAAPVALAAAALYQSRPAEAITDTQSQLAQAVHKAIEARPLQFYLPVQDTSADGPPATHVQVESPQAVSGAQQRPDLTPQQPSPTPPPAIRVSTREHQSFASAQQGCAAGYADTVEQVSTYFQLEPQLVLRRGRAVSCRRPRTDAAHP